MLAPLLLPTTLVGSYPQPEWLIDRARLAKQVPRVRAQRSLARRAAEARSGAGRRHAPRHPRSGTRRARHHHRRRAAARELFQSLRHRARRHRPRSTRERRRTAPAGSRPCRASWGRSGAAHPVEVRDVEFLRANTDRKIKMTVPGPFTMAAQCQDDFYHDDAQLALDYAARGQCRDQGFVRGRRRHRADR